MVGRRPAVEDLPPLQLHVRCKERQQRGLGVIGPEDDLGIELWSLRREVPVRDRDRANRDEDGVEDVGRRLTGVDDGRER